MLVFPIGTKCLLSDGEIPGIILSIIIYDGNRVNYTVAWLVEGQRQVENFEPVELILPFDVKKQKIGFKTL